MKKIIQEGLYTFLMNSLPISTIHSSYKPDNAINQSFKIDNWILKRNGMKV